MKNNDTFESENARSELDELIDELLGIDWFTEEQSKVDESMPDIKNMDYIEESEDSEDEKSAEEIEKLKEAAKKKEEEAKEKIKKAKLVLAQLNQIRKTVLPRAREVMETNREDVFDAIQTALHVLNTAYYDGLDPLLREGETMASGDSSTKAFFALGIKEKSMIYHTAIPEMLEEYEKRQRNVVEDYICYMYMRTMHALYIGLNPRIARIILRSMLPPEERKRFDKFYESLQTNK